MPKTKILDSDIYDFIDQSVEILKSQSVKFPHFFLTEEDLRAHLFNHLLNIHPFFNTPQVTASKTLSIPLHTEIRFYGAEGLFNYRSDIVIFDPTDLRTEEGEDVKLPSKGFAFNNFYCIIELKLRRVNGKNDQEFIKEILKDLQKLVKLSKSAESFNKINTAQFYIIALDKKGDISKVIDPEVRRLIGQNKNFHWIYIN